MQNRPRTHLPKLSLHAIHNQAFQSHLHVVRHNLQAEAEPISGSANNGEFNLRVNGSPTRDCRFGRPGRPRPTTPQAGEVGRWLIVR